MTGTGAAAHLHILRQLPALDPGLTVWAGECHDALCRETAGQEVPGREDLT